MLDCLAANLLVDEVVMAVTSKIACCQCLYVDNFSSIMVLHLKLS